MKSHAVSQCHRQEAWEFMQSHCVNGFPHSAREVAHSILAVREVPPGNANSPEKN